MRPSVREYFDAEHNLDLLIKVQACFRAFLARKKYAKLRSRALFSGGHQTADGTSHASHGAHYYNYKSSAVDRVIAEYGGPFIYDNDPASEEMLEMAGFST